MRGPACTCSVRAPPASAAGCFRAGRGGGPRSGLAALRPDDFRLRASGSRRPAPGAALTPRNAWLLGNSTLPQTSFPRAHMLCAGPPNHGLGPFRGPQAQNYARATGLVVSASPCERDNVQCGCPSIPPVPRGVYPFGNCIYWFTVCPVSASSASITRARRTEDEAN
ncbi:uncharacterized protein LOC143267471 [Peromyscus maniculatus bairdii]|uniref:uncharacterized protein LOC143267471 n=1 Tax=Peromyscus maniculatus bairdii TaxID=230844 RepID=UPI003FCFCBA5